MLSQPRCHIHEIADKDSAEEYQRQADTPIIEAQARTNFSGCEASNHDKNAGRQHDDVEGI